MKKNMFLTSRVNIIILFTMIFMLSGIVCSMAQISGTVVDNEGIPIIGANIIEEGTTNGTVTDIDGKFTLEIADNAVLRVSYIGYLEQTIETKGRTTINITLLEDTQALEEVVVVGYGTMKRSSLTGSVSRVETEQIEAFPSTNVVDALQGQAAGVYITPSRQP